MKYLFVLVFLLSGCATTTPNPWTGIEVSSKAAATPVDCGRFPLPSDVIGDDIVYDNAAANDLEAYRACSEANKGIASEHAQQIDQLRIATRGLVEAGKAQRNIADMKQQMLDEERRHHFWQSLGYWVLIVGSVAL